MAIGREQEQNNITPYFLYSVTDIFLVIEVRFLIFKDKEVSARNDALRPYTRPFADTCCSAQ